MNTFAHINNTFISMRYIRVVINPVIDTSNMCAFLLKMCFHSQIIILHVHLHLIATTYLGNKDL